MKNTLPTGYAAVVDLYLEAGWLGVLPLPAGHKYPPPSGFTGGQGGNPSREQIDLWCSQFEDGNVALRLPDGIIGIDLDVYKHEGAQQELESLMGCALQPTWCSSSRDDGSGIYFYRVPILEAGMRWMSAPVAGVEIVQWRHRYAVVWPSLHPEGRPYLWRETYGDLVDCRVPAPDDLSRLPRSAAQKLLEKTAGFEEREAADFDLTRGLPSPRVKALLRRGLDATNYEEGPSRHDAVGKVVMAMVRSAKDGEPGVKRAIRQLRAVFVSAVGHDRPGGEKQATREFNDLVQGAQEKVARTERPPVSSNGQGPRDSRLTFRTLRERLPEYQEPQWLIRNFLINDAFDVIGGAEKSLKSWLMHHCGIALAAGIPLFNDPWFSVEEAGTVVLLTGEGGVDLVIDRVRHLCEGLYEIPFEQVLDNIVVSADIAPMTSEHFAGDVQEVIEKYDPVLFQLDPLYVYFGEDREAGNVYSAGPALMGLRQLTLGRALQVAHHFTKAAADKLTLASLTQAGMREAVDHWLLVAVDDYDLEAQRFELRFQRGARRGLAWSKRAEVILGPFDPDTLRHEGTPSVSFIDYVDHTDKKREEEKRACAVEATKLCKERMREDISAGREVQGVPQSWLRESIQRKVRATTKVAGIEEAVLAGSLSKTAGKRGANLYFYVKDYPLPED